MGSADEDYAGHLEADVVRVLSEAPRRLGFERLNELLEEHLGYRLHGPFTESEDCLSAGAPGLIYRPGGAF